MNHRTFSALLACGVLFGVACDRTDCTTSKSSDDHSSGSYVDGPAPPDPAPGPSEGAAFRSDARSLTGASSDLAFTSYGGKLTVSGFLSGGDPLRASFVLVVPNVRADTTIPLAQESQLCDALGLSCVPLQGTLVTTSFATDCSNDAGCLVQLQGHLVAASTSADVPFSLDLALDHHESFGAERCFEDDSS